MTPKYYPFGECRNSPPYPTDRLFTGQRLDETGLYYYNARYYDPTIGRFISADTVVPNPGNPQCFNRYSYCLNNPLKYVDPSGQEVRIGGQDVWDLYNDPWAIYNMTDEDRQLWEAWRLMMDVDWNLTSRLANSRIRIVTIVFANPYDPNAGGYSTPPDLIRAGLLAGLGLGEWIDWSIRLGSDFAYKDSRSIAVALAHELMHVDSTLSDSVQEELIAHQYADWVADRLFPGTTNDTLGLRSLNPKSWLDLWTARGKLMYPDSPAYYGRLPLFPALRGIDDLRVAIAQGIGVPWWLLPLIR